MSVAELSLRDVLPLNRGYRDRNISSVGTDPAFEETKLRLILLAFHFRQTDQVTDKSWVSALRVLYALPADRAIPKLAVDGEGGFIFVWELGSAHTLLTVADQELWPVFQAATANAHHGHPFSAFAGDLRQRLIKIVPGR